MWFTSKNKKLTSEEYELLSKRMTGITGMVEDCRLQVVNLEMSISKFRGIVNRKFGGEKEAPPQDPPEEKKESNLKPSVLLNPNGGNL